MQEKIQQVVLGLIAIFSIVFSTLDWLNIFSLPANTISSLTLLGVGLTAGYLALERRAKLESIDRRLNSIEKRFSQVNAFFSALKERDHFSEIVLIYGLRAYGKLLSGNSISVDHERALELWKDAIGGCKQWLAIDYSRHDETWNLGWGDAIAKGIQHERIRAGAVIKRVFLVDDQNEYEVLKKAMIAQENIGISVRWLLREELDANKRISELIKSLGTHSFAIVDDSWLFVDRLDKKRHQDGAGVIKDQETTDKAKFIFNEAFTKGRRLEN